MEGLECSNCKSHILVTWSRYWKSSFGFYYCPDCQAKLKFSTAPKWIQFTSWAVQLVAIAICYLSIKRFGFSGCLSLLILIPVFVLDKQLDTKYGRLKKPHNKSLQQDK